MDLWEMEDGRQWRRSRDMEVLATALMWLVSMLTDKASVEAILETLPGYRRP